MAPIQDNHDNNIRQQEGQVNRDPLKKTYDSIEERPDNPEDKSSAPRTDDLDSGTLTDRPHGRTNPPLGPDHEPGTHG